MAVRAEGGKREGIVSPIVPSYSPNRVFVPLCPAVGTKTRA